MPAKRRLGWLHQPSCVGCWVGGADPAYGPSGEAVGWVGFINPAAWGAGSVELTQPTRLTQPTAWLTGYLTRETYSPERVSTLITSSWQIGRASGGERVCQYV